jgi:hypothetical protein
MRRSKIDLLKILFVKGLGLIAWLLLIFIKIILFHLEIVKICRRISSHFGCVGLREEVFAGRGIL